MSEGKQHRKKAYKGSSGRGKSADKMPYLDYRILKTLPDEGTKLDFKEAGLNIKAIANAIGAKKSDHYMIAGRCLSLKFLGYAVAVQLLPSYQGAGYQITKLGKEAVLEYERENPKDKVD